MLGGLFLPTLLALPGCHLSQRLGHMKQKENPGAHHLFPGLQVPDCSAQCAHLLFPDNRQLVYLHTEELGKVHALLLLICSIPKVGVLFPCYII